MILFFRTPQKSVIATEVDRQLSADEVKELCWLYGDAVLEEGETLKGWFVGPRREMITPWSTHAVEITQNMNLHGIARIEEYFPVASADAEHDPMLQRRIILCVHAPNRCFHSVNGDADFLLADNPTHAVYRQNLMFQFICQKIVFL